jgi:hypothetical protein
MLAPDEPDVLDTPDAKIENKLSAFINNYLIFPETKLFVNIILLATLIIII